MNRYQQEVEEMDARHHWRVRAITFLGTLAFAVFVLWAADFRIGNVDLVTAWWHQGLLPDKDKSPALASQTLTTEILESDSLAKDSMESLPGTESSISKVPLPLILARTEPSLNTREGRAYLGVARANPQTYAVGAILANGARLKEIYADHVVVERDGTSVNLYVDGNKQNSKTLNDLLTVGGTPAPNVVVTRTNEILTDYIRPSPVYDGDFIKGYQVYAGQRSGVFSQMGLKDGDVVLTINDISFSDSQQAIDMFKKVTSGIAVDADVERNGKVERIELDGALVTADQERIKNPPPTPVMPMEFDM
jgi:hypothetical protein